MKMIAMALMMSLGLAQQAFSMDLPTCEQAKVNDDTKRMAMAIVLKEWKRVGEDLEKVRAENQRLHDEAQSGRVSRNEGYARAVKISEATRRLQGEAQAISRLSACIQRP